MRFTHRAKVKFIIRTEAHKPTVYARMPLWICRTPFCVITLTGICVMITSIHISPRSYSLHCTTKLNSCTANAEFTSHSGDAEICWAAIWTERRGLERDSKCAGNARSAERAPVLRSIKRLYAHRYIKIDSPLTGSLWQPTELLYCEIYCTNWKGSVVILVFLVRILSSATNRSNLHLVLNTGLIKLRPQKYFYTS